MHHQARAGEFQNLPGQPDVVRMQMRQEQHLDVGPLDAALRELALERIETFLRADAGVDQQIALVQLDQMHVDGFELPGHGKRDGVDSGARSSIALMRSRPRRDRNCAPAGRFRRAGIPSRSRGAFRSANSSSVDVAHDRQMLRRRPQILAERQDVDVARAQIAHHGQHFVDGLAQAEHQSGLGRRFRTDLLRRTPACRATAHSARPGEPGDTGAARFRCCDSGYPGAASSTISIAACEP